MVLSSPRQMRADAKGCQVSDRDEKDKTRVLEERKPGSRGEQAG